MITPKEAQNLAEHNIITMDTYHRIVKHGKMHLNLHRVMLTITPIAFFMNLINKNYTLAIVLAMATIGCAISKIRLNVLLDSKELYVLNVFESYGVYPKPGEPIHVKDL